MNSCQLSVFSYQLRGLVTIQLLGVRRVVEDFYKPLLSEA